MGSREQTTGPTTLSRVLAIFREKINHEVPSVDADLFEEAILDSLAFVKLLVYLEEEFGVQLSLDNLGLDDFRSIARIAQLLENVLLGSRVPVEPAVRPGGIAAVAGGTS